MTLKDIVKWNKRVSAVYALGVWTIICSLAYYKYTGRLEGTTVKEEVDKEEDLEKQVYSTAHTKTVVVYKKDFVPYSTRIHNLIKSFSGEPGPEDGDK